MQYDTDSVGEFADIFKKIRAILLSYSQIIELKNAKQTSYRDEYGVVAMMRSRDNSFVVAWGRGFKLQEKFPLLKGKGKIVRHLYFKTIDEVDENLLRSIIEESFIIGLEIYELKLLSRR